MYSLPTEPLIELGFTDAQISTLCSACCEPVYKMLILDAVAGFSDGQSSKQSSHSVIMEVLVEHTTQVLLDVHKSRIAEGRFTTISVAAPVPYSYTIGLSAFVGYEIIGRGLIPSDLMESLINEMGQRAVAGEYMTGVRGSRLNDINGESHRLILNRVEDTENALDHLLLLAGSVVFVPDRPKQVYQLYVGDCDNRLPGEDGYNNVLLQELYPVLEE